MNAEFRASLETIVSLSDRLAARLRNSDDGEMARLVVAAGRSLLDRIGGAPPMSDDECQNDELPGDAGPERKLSVLIADDNDTTRQIIAKVLERAGHQVSTAIDGNAALIALRDTEFDVVLMDVDMPDMNGIEATKLYRFSSIGRPRVPIVALTMDASPEASKLYQDAGMNGRVVKPIDPARLLEAIEDAMRPGEARNDAMSDRSIVPLKAPTPIEAVDDPEGSVVDIDTLVNLERLGGQSFVADLVAQFAHDARAHLQQLQAAVARQDAHAFHEIAHALRSSAANVGATRIFEICLAVRAVSEEELTTDGAKLVQRITHELDRAIAVLDTEVGRFGAGEHGIRANAG